MGFVHQRLTTLRSFYYRMEFTGSEKALDRMIDREDLSRSFIITVSFSSAEILFLTNKKTFITYFEV